MVDRGIKLAIFHGPGARRKAPYVDDLRRLHVNGLDIHLDEEHIIQDTAGWLKRTCDELFGMLKRAAIHLERAGWTVLWDDGPHTVQLDAIELL